MILALLSSPWCRAQQYRFDHMISYEYANYGGKFEVVNFINSGNYKYGLRFLKGSAVDGRVTAAISDHLLRETHYFHARENGGNDVVSFDFEYRGTKKWENDEYRRRVSNYDAVLVPTGDSLTAKLTIFENKRRKKIRAEAWLKLSRSKIDFVPAARFSMMDHMLSEQQLSYPFPAVIESVSYYVKGNELTERRKMIKPVKLELSVSKKIYRDGSPTKF